jgi:hypothetical protein
MKFHERRPTAGHGLRWLCQFVAVLARHFQKAEGPHNRLQLAALQSPISRTWQETLLARWLGFLYPSACDTEPPSAVAKDKPWAKASPSMETAE